MFTLKYNAKTVHITGLVTAEYGVDAGTDVGDRVTYSPESHCPALTRSGSRMMSVSRGDTVPSDTPGRVRHVTVVVDFPSAVVALAAAERHATLHGRAVCATCRSHIR